MDKACTGGFACHFLPGETSDRVKLLRKAPLLLCGHGKIGSFPPPNIEIVLTRPPSLKIS